MTDIERAAFDRGWDDGVHNSVNACFPQYKRAWPHSFDTPNEEAAYERGYQKGCDGVD